ncbi:MAG TPA: CHAD domain-containing protein [Flavobacteriales bacterium]|nr:CHAD domain-containing protein [Flavobacteriales bacterium]
MNTREKIKKTIIKHSTKAIERLIAFHEHSNAEDMHKFRISIKKLKAISVFFTSHKKPAFTQSFLPVKTVYRQLGEIRTSQLILEQLETHHGDAAKKEMASLKLVNDCLLFHLRFPSIIQELQKHFSKLNTSLRPIKKRKIKSRLYDRLEKTCNCMQKAKKNTELFHACRKKIKKILYVAENTKTNMNLKKLDVLQDELGKLHDIQEALIFTRKDKKLALKLKKDEQTVLNRINKMPVNPANYLK